MEWWGRWLNQSTVALVNVFTNNLTATSSVGILITVQAEWKALKWSSVEILPSPLNLGNTSTSPLGNEAGFTPRFSGPIFWPHGWIVAMFGNGIACRGWTLIAAGMSAFKGSKDCTKGKTGDYFGGELGLLWDLTIFFLRSSKSGSNFKFFNGSNFSSRIPFSLSPLVYLRVEKSWWV